MWIPSSPCKNRVSDRGRIDIFSRGSISGWKASLLLLALASFSVVCAASGLPEWCRDKPDTCFAKNSDELKDGKRDDIVINDSGITWDATDASSIDLYTQKCGKLSFNMSLVKPADLDEGGKCEFSMRYTGCDVGIVWSKNDLDFTDKENRQTGVQYPGMEANVELNGASLSCTSENRKVRSCDSINEDFCGFKPSKDGDWCSFEFAFKKTGSCDGHGLQAPCNTSTDDCGSNYDSRVLGGIGFVVFWICRRKRRRSAERMAEKGNMGSDCQCESTIPPPKSPIKIPRKKKSGSEMVVDEPSTKDEDGDGSKLASNVEASKPVSQMQKNSKNMPLPSPSPLPEENKPKRILTPDELYEPLGDPMKAIPMHLSEKKVSEKKKGHGMNFANRKPYKRPQT
ncbi:hypothetical protein Ddc_13973 [Ditylenchus destructor]|nr:hypothetical protein Ddc_13973 [Ditylenchus destructor]